MRKGLIHNRMAIPGLVHFIGAKLYSCPTYIGSQLVRLSTLAIVFSSQIPAFICVPQNGLQPQIQKILFLRTSLCEEACKRVLTCSKCGISS